MFCSYLFLVSFRSSSPGTPFSAPSPVPEPSSEPVLATASTSVASPDVPNPGPKPLNEGAPAPETSAEPDKASPVAPQTRVSPKDFGHVIGTATTDEQKMTALTDRWCPSGKEEYPVSYHKKQGVTRPRRLNGDHLKRYSWLAVSRLGDRSGAWCSTCVLFGGGESGGRGGSRNKPLGKLVLRPLVDFSDLTGKCGALSIHENTEYHRTSAARAAEFVARRHRPQLDVAVQAQTAGQREVERNRAIVSAIVETIKLAAMQNIAIRGHRDDGRIDPSGEYPETNDGNFRMLLRFRIQSGDTALQKHLAKAAGNALYTSKQIQNTILQDMASLIKQDIAQRVSHSKIWALMADETTDCSNREQMALVIRYVDELKGQLIIREDPVSLIDVFATLRQLAGETEKHMSGMNLARVITAALAELKLDSGAMVAQCYDGAACMSSERVGVAAQIREESPLAHYFHCAVHALNLATSRINQVDAIRNALGTMETAVSFLTDGAKREELLHTAQHERLAEGERRKLLKLCQTRFVERHVAVERFWEQLPAVCLALELMTEWQDRRTSSQAANLLIAVTQGAFLVGLAVAQRLSGVLRPLAAALQEKGMDLVRCLELVDAVIKILEDMRANSDREFATLMSEAASVAAKINADISKPRLPSRSVHRSTAGQNLSVEDYFRVNVFLPAIDAVLTNTKDRFGVHQRKAFLLSQLLPRNVVRVTWGQLEPAFIQYASLVGDCTEQLRAELRVWTAMWENRTDTVAPRPR